MTITTLDTDRGAAACLALISELPGVPLVLETWSPSDNHTVHLTENAAGQAADLEWCVALTPTAAAVSVRAQLAYNETTGQWDLAELRPGAGEFAGLILVPYPDDPELITAPGYQAALRQAILEASAAVRGCRSGHPGWRRADHIPALLPASA